MFKTKNEYSSAMTKRVWFERFYMYIYTRRDRLFSFAIKQKALNINLT